MLPLHSFYLPFSLFLLLIVFSLIFLSSLSFLSPFVCFFLLLFLSLLFLSDSLIYSGSVSVASLPSLPHPFSFSRLFTYEGLFLLRVALFSEIHKSKSDHCPHALPTFSLDLNLDEGGGLVS